MTYVLDGQINWHYTGPIDLTSSTVVPEVIYITYLDHSKN